MANYYEVEMVGCKACHILDICNTRYTTV